MGEEEKDGKAGACSREGEHTLDMSSLSDGCIMHMLSYSVYCFHHLLLVSFDE